MKILRLLVLVCGMTFCLGVNAQTTNLYEQTSNQKGVSNQREYDFFFHEAMLQRHKGHHSAAYDLLSRCIELNPQASEAYFFQAQYLMEMHQKEQALVAYERAVALNPNNMTLLEELSHAYIANDQYGDAIRVVEHMYEIDKGRQNLLELLYQLYLKEERYEEAIGVLDRIEQIDGRTERTSLAKSGLYLQLNEHAKAMDEVRILSEKHPNDLNYRTLYANTLMMNGETDEAYALLRQVLSEEPDNNRAQQTLRNYYLMQGDSLATDSLTRRILLNPKATLDERVYLLRTIMTETENAGGDSTRVLKLFDEIMAQPEPDPDMAEFRAAYMDLKKMPREEVEAAFEKVLELAPDRATSRLQLVQFAWQANDDQRIIDLCKAARQYNPDEMAFYYYQGMAYYRQEDTDHALEAFQNGISVIDDTSSPEIVSDFYAVMGDLLFEKKREAEAFAAYDSCLQWKPDNVGCLNNYAYYLSLKNERLKDAEEMSYKTVKAEPENSTYLDTYAWILFMQGRYAEAKVYIAQALQHDDDVGAVVTEHAGDIYAMNGETDKALELWQQALAQDPKNKMLAKKIKQKKYIKAK